MGNDVRARRFCSKTFFDSIELVGKRQERHNRTERPAVSARGYNRTALTERGYSGQRMRMGKRKEASLSTGLSETNLGFFP